MSTLAKDEGFVGVGSIVIRVLFALGWIEWLVRLAFPFWHPGLIKFLTDHFAAAVNWVRKIGRSDAEPASARCLKRASAITVPLGGAGFRFVGSPCVNLLGILHAVAQATTVSRESSSEVMPVAWRFVAVLVLFYLV